MALKNREYIFIEDCEGPIIGARPSHAVLIFYEELPFGSRENYGVIRLNPRIRDERLQFRSDLVFERRGHIEILEKDLSTRGASPLIQRYALERAKVFQRELEERGILATIRDRTNYHQQGRDKIVAIESL